jgi:hypothetical protein
VKKIHSPTSETTPSHLHNEKHFFSKLNFTFELHMKKHFSSTSSQAERQMVMRVNNGSNSELGMCHAVEITSFSYGLIYGAVAESNLSDTFGTTTDFFSPQTLKQLSGMFHQLLQQILA